MKEEYKEENLVWYICPECGNEEKHEVDYFDTCSSCWLKGKNIRMRRVK